MNRRDHIQQLFAAMQHDLMPSLLHVIPLAVDGAIVVASMSILLANRYGSRGGVLAWTMLMVGTGAGIRAANGAGGRSGDAAHTG